MTQIGRALFILTAALLFSLPAHAFEGDHFLMGTQGEQRGHKLALGARYHDKIKGMPELPFDKGDLSWLLAYEYHAPLAFWQLGLGYTPESNTDSGAKVFTPQINLIFKDSIYRLGAGALKSYVDVDGETDWTDIYWQMIAGIEVPLGAHASLGLYGCYVFNKWDEITQTDDNGITGNLLLSVGF
ncbi:hypothetical protein [Desulfoluna sp.]|uniref:hypothetical protein n=1 Tax=Desulfoluna sp. TaxID=2045199 RepID=UPI002629A383|nr:hypothetical protein [Desulfoluna sp.]